jgi:dTDP-4-amino-4,6-dideoxygalactose transaminase
LQAAMGLSVLPYMKEIMESREKNVHFYNDNLNFSKIRSFNLRDKSTRNYSYYPIIFQSEEILLKVQKALNEEQIFPRRYFHPSLNKIKYLNVKEMPISEIISSRIMCLPLAFGMERSVLNNICSIVNTITAKYDFLA